MRGMRRRGDPAFQDMDTPENRVCDGEEQPRLACATGQVIFTPPFAPGGPIRCGVG
jgi:hypothetical protein